MTDDDSLQEMFALREDKGWTYGRLARRFGVSVSTVSYHCLIAGVERPGRFPVSTVRAGAIERRGDHWVRRFTAEEDALVLSMAMQGKNHGQIGRACSPPRRPNTIKARLATLARRDARAEAMS